MVFPCFHLTPEGWVVQATPGICPRGPGTPPNRSEAPGFLGKPRWGTPFGAAKGDEHFCLFNRMLCYSDIRPGRAIKGGVVQIPQVRSVLTPCPGDHKSGYIYTYIYIYVYVYVYIYICSIPKAYEGDPLIAAMARVCFPGVGRY